MSDIALLWSTFTDASEAERVAQAVLAEKLAVCVNILAPCTSIYRWQGQVEHGQEVPAIFKTSTMLARRLRDRIAALHGYDLPVIESWTAGASDAVSGWIAAETGA